MNALIHADYSGRVSVLVVRRPDGFSFRNPGALRLPLIDVLDGGTSDCRNRNLQKMFQLAGLGEQAGSGVPRIYRNWKEQHWRAPELWDDLDPDRTQLEMRMVSLLPEQTLIELDERFGPAFRSLPEVQRLALATVAIEGRVTNARLQRMTSVHPRDLTQELAGLVRAGYLVSAGAARGTYYVFATDGVTEEKGLERSVVQGELRFPHNVGNSPHNEGSSTHNRVDSPHSLDASPPMLDDPNVTLVRRQRRVAPAVMERAIIATIMHRFVPLRELAVLLDRAPRTLQDHYLRPLVEAGRVELRHPDRPNHPDQAYRAARNATRD